jgi:beta-glucosidase
MMKLRLAALPLALFAAALALPAPAQQGTGGDPDARAAALVAQMTLEEKIRLVHGNYPNRMEVRPEGVPMSAGYVPGIERLGIPAQRMTDASLGVAAAHQFDNPATALPSGLAQAASFDPRVAFTGGATIGREAREKGFNVMLAGGANLVREPRNGRNFEYLGEDALLAGIMAGEAVRGIQSNGIVSTTKHFALNAQETGRHVLDARIDEAALRESDLLAFQKIIEISDPGAIMCAYNKVNGDYACENQKLISIARDEWGWKGWMMSDWGAVHSTVKAVYTGLDQQMGEELDPQLWFGPKMLGDAVRSGALREAQIDAMVQRILRSYFAKGVMDNPVQQGRQPNLVPGAAVTQDAAAKGIVLLKNDRGVLPLAANAARIAVIGGNADIGILSGGGSSQVKPAGIQLLPPPSYAPSFIRNLYLHPSRPLDAIKAAAPWANVTYSNGADVGGAASAARNADVAIVFATQFATEGMDAEMKLDGNQDALIAAVARENPNTVVVLVNGGPIFMPWLDQVGAVVEAWYPGGRGGEAIADVLTGKVNPSGRLPVTFPSSTAQLPNPELPGIRLPRPDNIASSQPEPFPMTYPEGADVGYRWFQRKGQLPLFPFGFGLSYTTFAEDLTAFDPATMTATITVTNLGERVGTDTPQLYMTPPGEAARLVGWAKVEVAPAATKTVRVAIDPRFAARFDVARKQWVVRAGTYSLRVASSAIAPGVTIQIQLPESRLPVNWKPTNALAPVAIAD